MSYEIIVSSDDSDVSRGYYSDSFQFSPDSFNSMAPVIEIVEQPGDFRYRYEKEKYHGHLLGISSPLTKKKDLCKFPSIKVHNCKNDVLVRCWLISSKLEKPTAHFHKLARKPPKGELKLEPHDFYATDRNNYEVTFDYLHIVHAVMNDPRDVQIYGEKKAWLESGSFQRPKFVDATHPLDREEMKLIERNQSVLYFEAFDAHSGEKLCEAVSRKIKNLHNPETAVLKIVNYSKTYGTCKGGDEVFILVEKISKDVEVRFFELKYGSSERLWEARAIFGPQNIHHQYAIVCRTPPYQNEYITNDVQVYMELYRKTDLTVSEPVKFTYKPDEYCRMFDVPRKRPHSPDSLATLSTNNGNVLLSQSAVKRSKEASMSPDSTTMYTAIPAELGFDDFQLENLQNAEFDLSTLNWSQVQFNNGDSLLELDSDLNCPDIQTLLANDKFSSDGVGPKKEISSSKDKGICCVQMDTGNIYQKDELCYLDDISSQEVSSTNDASDSLPIGIENSKFKDMVYAIKSDDGVKRFEKMIHMLDSNCLNAVDFGGNSIFLIASGCSQDAVKILLDRKDLNIYLKNLAGDNALLIAAKKQRLDLVEELLKSGFEPNDQNYKTGETALHIAVATENLPLMNLLLKYGANPLIDNYGLFSPYDYSTNSDNSLLRKIIYEKAQEYFIKQRKTLGSSTYSISEGMSGRDVVHCASDKIVKILAEQCHLEHIYLLIRNCFSTEAKFHTKDYKLHKIEGGPSTEALLHREDALKYYEQMLMIRRLETAAGNLYKEKLVRGFCHLYSGQEACAVGMKAVMRPMDSIIAGYRIHGWTYLMGNTVYEVISELMGKRTGTSRGKGGSMHMYGKNFFGGNGIVGAQVPIGAGVALADQYLKTGGVCFSLYGDGAANQGQVYEAFNMAMLWKLPCVFVCENNGYAMGTSVDRSTASSDYYSRGDYIPGTRVDGMDILAVREASKFAIEHCTSGKGPILLEFVTYRYSGHSMSDPGTTYRTRDEVQLMRQSKDPISSFREKILSENLVSEVELKAIDSQTKEEVAKAVSKAKTEREIGEEELTADVYSNSVEEKIRNINPWEPLKHIQVSNK